MHGLSCAQIIFDKFVEVTDQESILKVRHRQTDQACVVETIGNNICPIKFEHSQRAVTPGQFGA